MIKAKSSCRTKSSCRKLLKSRKQNRKSFKKQTHYKEIIEMEIQSLRKLLKFKLIRDILKVSTQDSRLRIKKGEERKEQNRTANFRGNSIQIIRLQLIRSK